MTGKVHLVRHAESVHNVDKNFDRLDPGLTPLGKEQASGLSRTFPDASKIGVVITSPLRRTIQTTLLAFKHVLDTRYFPPGSEDGVEGGASLILDPNLQERSDLPCDTGSDSETLKAEFLGLDFSGLEKGWTSKKGVYAADDKSVEARARKVRGELKERVENLGSESRSDVVVVTHGVFMKFLSGNQDIDLPKAGWKSFAIGEDGVGEVILIPV